MAKDEREIIGKSIDRARDGVSDRIDELDARLRATLDVKSKAREHAPKIIGAGAIAGFLAGFGFPKGFRRVLMIGLPLAFAALQFKGRSRGADESGDYKYDVE